MKVVFVGGGAHRYLGVARTIMDADGLMADGQINVFDLNPQRGEVMGRMIQKAPEYASSGCEVVWDSTLDEALDGADLVIVVFMAGDMKLYEKGNTLSGKYGFIGSDQLSPNGAFLALKGGPTVMNIARKMEKLCPDALLLDFANPVAVLSAAVNNHTKIKCLGVCAGYTNHLWNLNWVLGVDTNENNFRIKCAGVNHMSFILRDSQYITGEDLYEKIDRAIEGGWELPKLQPIWTEFDLDNINSSLDRMLKLYKKYNWMIFSTEADGLAHMDISGHYKEWAHEQAAKTDAMIDAELQAMWQQRNTENERFESFLDADDSIWTTKSPETFNLTRFDDNIMARCIKAWGGMEDMDIATSYPNYGAVKGFDDRTVLEYSQVLSKDGITAVDGLEVPEVFYGMTSALASHQTLLGDAIATEDPRLLFEALYSYPIQQDTKNSKTLFKELIKLNETDIPANFQKTIDYFNI